MSRSASAEDRPWSGLSRGQVCGLDEAGRGPLAGPVSGAAVILDPRYPVDGLDDSKKLSPRRRETLAGEIRQRALGWGQAFVWPDEIERLNIHHASLRAMYLAVEDMIRRFPECLRNLAMVVSDGKFCPDVSALTGPLASWAQVKGDSLVAEVSAASILAKTSRDAYMRQQDALDGRYGFGSHMGYPTQAHREALERHGPGPIHRLSWVVKFLGC